MGSTIALFVDGDNISPYFSEEIMAFAKQLGRLDVARVYGGAHPASGWMEAPGFRFVHAGPGKNGADILLSIDAIEACDGAAATVATRRHLRRIFRFVDQVIDSHPQFFEGRLTQWGAGPDGIERGGAA